MLRIRCAPLSRALGHKHTRVCRLWSGSESCQVRFCSSEASRKETPKRKIKQRLVRPTPTLDNGDGICAAYCVSTPVSLSGVSDFFKAPLFSVGKQESSQTFRSTGLKIFSGDVVHVPLQSAEESDLCKGHAFFFSSGAAVFWGLPTEIRRQLLDLLSKFQERPARTGIQGITSKYVIPLSMEEFDHEFKYTIDNNRKQAAFKNDAIYLSDFSDPAQLLALSYGLAQSVKLLLFEEIIDSLVHRTRTLPDELARDGKIKLSQRDLKKLIGELLTARYSVNLVSDILDTPEYFWQHPQLENLHLECSREVELRQRARILDTRTQVIKDALDILNNELSSSSSNRVERAILFLIAVEVSFEIARLLPTAANFF